MNSQDRKILVDSLRASLHRPKTLDRASGPVQAYVSTLENQLAETLKRVDELTSDGDTSSNVRISGHGVEADRLIGNDEQVMFFMGRGRRRIDDCITVRHDRQNEQRTVLRVEAVGRRIVILPSASNSFSIRFED